MVLTALVYGPPPEGCGLRRGTPLEQSVRAWAMYMAARTEEIRPFEARLLRRLRSAGLVAPRRPPTERGRPDEEVTQIDRFEDGTTQLTRFDPARLLRFERDAK